MFVPLRPEGVRAFRILNEISLAFDVIDFETFVEREEYLRELLGDPGTGGTPGGGDAPSPPPEPERPPETQEEVAGTAHPGLGARGGSEGDDWLQFIPGGPIAYLHRWQFIVGDPDPHPSVPHGHDNGRPFPKLDPYLGWIHVSTTKTGGRLSKDDTRALWNDERFRDFASAALVHFVRENPSYRWRVDNPLRIPRRR